MDFPIPDGDDRPRSMRDPKVRERRQLMLGARHMLPLMHSVERGRGTGLGEVPNFDPLDGGIYARALFLFEKPGPMTSEGATGNRSVGSGFISRNNDDRSAQATFDFMVKAGIPRRLTVTWNVVPWWNGTTKVTGGELRQGVACIQELVALLPELRAVVFVGKQAAKARRLFEDPKLVFFESAHPSPRVKASWRSRWEAISDEWAKVLPYIQ